MMLGFLLARAGIDVVVLEKHADFLRDFRGDTIHPSTLQIMHELGLLDEFLKLPHTKERTISGVFGAAEYTFADFGHLPTAAKYIALMPQWDFLDFLARHGQRYPNFHLRTRAEATGLIEDSGRVAGVRVVTPEGPLDVRAGLVVACDGRRSTMRERAGMQVEDIGAPMDVLWFRVPHRPHDPASSMGRFDAGRLIVLINRGDYWQCAFVIPKGGIAKVQQAGLAAFRASLAASVPAFADRVDDIKDWSEIKLLTVAVDRLTTWHKPGLLCIGDAAHAMSPIGGVGVNLAIQDAVATANLLWEPLRRGQVSGEDLARVQQRRQFPAKITQRIQVALQNNVISPALQSTGPVKPPLAIRLTDRFPLLRRIPARMLGLGVRPEHVQVPEMAVK
jgi:2-polyprenyl-6-methoxyphenol hydroxylase-like FAD-dependent oxidoreductase